MDNTQSRMTPADALVIFGVTGDLAHKMIFPALYAMARRGVLNVPVVGVAAPKWSDGALFTREDAVEAAWTVVDTVLDTHHRAHRYKPGGWGPRQADALIAADGSWHNPVLVKTGK